MIIFQAKKVFIRFFIFCFWIAVIFLFLFSPRVYEFFVEKKSISVFTFPKFIDAELVSKFEKENGIKVHINYYENNDELLVKLRKTKGDGFDVIIPSDYAVEMLINEGLIKKIDKSKLNFLNKIDTRYLGQYFDLKNQYSIPYAWETYKIGYNKRLFKGVEPINSWKLIFDPNYAPKSIVMNNTPREAILLAAYYLFGSIDNIDDAKLEQIKNLLIKQKEWVEVYSDRRSDYYLSSETCPVAVGSSGEIWKAVRADRNLGFLIPKEGTFLIIDSVALSSKSKNDNAVYKFINYLYSDEMVKHHVNKYSIFSVLKDMQLDDYFRESINRIRKEATKTDFFRNVLTEAQMNKVWIDLKVK